MSDKRYNIGILVANITDSFSSRVSAGAMLAAKELDANLFIFPGKYIDFNCDLQEVDSRYEYQYNALFSHAAAGKLDYLIVCVGTIAYMSGKERREKFLKLFDGTPLLCVASQAEGYDYVQYNNRTGICQAMDYLINEQGKKHICMMVGDLNNYECAERFSAYRDSLKKHGLTFEDRFIIESDISSFCRREADSLLKANPEADAVICVNDDMAATMYDSIKAVGKHIGRDIAVVGFDDLPNSARLEPPLASVKADAFELGYMAMVKTIHNLEGIPDSNHLLDTRFIPRQSSYSQTGMFFSADRIFSDGIQSAVSKIIAFTKTKSSPEESVESARLFCSDLLITLHRDFIVRAATDEDFRNVVDKIDSYFSRKTDVISSVSKIYTVVDSGYTWAKAICHEDSKKYIHKIYEYFYKRLSLDVVSDYKLLQDKQLYLNHMNNLVIRDTLMFEGSLKESYAQILKKLHCLDINTSYLYILDEPVKYQEGEVFPTDMKWNFKSYMYGANIYPVPDDEQKITAHEIFENKYLACERRHTLVVADLYSTEYQYGIALCEPRTTDFFYQLEMVTYQLSAAVKIIELLKGQEKMLTELHRTNLSLENMSKIDELTGIFNRRGFYSAANNLIASDRARGKQLVVCYGDMDSLKGVNDNYGHLEGDFALKSLAEIMVKVFGEKSIVARMGGDEYAAVALAEDVGDPEEIKRRRDEYEDTLNESAGKPYHIGISIGLYQCVCDNSYDLREAIDKADDLLYIEKAKRRRV